MFISILLFNGGSHNPHTISNKKKITQVILNTDFENSFHVDQAPGKQGESSSSLLEGLFSSDDEEEVQAPHGPTVTENNLDSNVTFYVALRLTHHI